MPCLHQMKAVVMWGKVLLIVVWSQCLKVFYILVTVRNHLCLNFADMKYRTIQVRLVLCVSLVGLIATQADQASFWNVRQKNTIHAMIILLYGLSQWMEKFMFNQIQIKMILHRSCRIVTVFPMYDFEASEKALILHQPDELYGHDSDNNLLIAVVTNFHNEVGVVYTWFVNNYVYTCGTSHSVIKVTFPGIYRCEIQYGEVKLTTLNLLKCSNVQLQGTVF